MVRGRKDCDKSIFWNLGRVNKWQEDGRHRRCPHKFPWIKIIWKKYLGHFSLVVFWNIWLAKYYSWNNYPGNTSSGTTPRGFPKFLTFFQALLRRLMWTCLVPLNSDFSNEFFSKIVFFQNNFFPGNFFRIFLWIIGSRDMSKIGQFLLYLQILKWLVNESIYKNEI